MSYTKKIGILTMSQDAGHEYAHQLQYLFESSLEVHCYSVQAGTEHSLKYSDLYIASQDAIGSCIELNYDFPIGAQILDVEVDFLKSNLKQLSPFPKGTKALFVNSSEFLAVESIARLHQLGIHNFDFIPFYPGLEPPLDVSLAVTAGDSNEVPTHIKNVIDFGCRRLSPQMIVEIALALDMKYILETDRFLQYASLFFSDSYGNTHKILRKSLYIEDCFNILSESIDDGIIGVNENGEVFCFNQKSATILGKEKNQILGKPVENALPFISISEWKNGKELVENHVEKFCGKYINLSIRPIKRHDKFKGIFAIFQEFSEVEQKQQAARKQILNKGHVAKYTFNNIIGNSEILQKTKLLAQRMAESNFVVLIYGKSGTGKELFSSAIHNASARKEYPFIPINCAALPETLLESELFGYEEGAFTGAKKGGKMGLFEFAHKGTLFLDEIENMSMALQVKLLRVLQEKEVMRIGGNSTINVDVRIIAATNEDLQIAMENGTFRADLFYRLSTLPLQLPTLNQRKEDILPLINYFKSRYGRTFHFTQEALNQLLAHDWKGNVRELQNYVEYFVCLAQEEIGMEELPALLLSSPETVSLPPLSVQSDQTKIQETFFKIAGSRKREYQFVIKSLYESYLKKEHIGRSGIVQQGEAESLFITEQEVRTILSKLKENGFVFIFKGRSGTQLTEMGSQLAQWLYKNG